MSPVDDGRPERSDASADGAGAAPPEGPLESRRSADSANGIIASMLAGPLMMGPAGWALDTWLGTAFLLPVGILVGVGLSGYSIWLRYGRP